MNGDLWGLMQLKICTPAFMVPVMGENYPHKFLFPIHPTISVDKNRSTTGGLSGPPYLQL